MIKSNPILARWATHKLENNNTKEVLPLLESYRLHIQQRDWEYDFEGHQDLIIGIPGLGETETPSQRAQTKPCVHQGPGERRGDPTGG